MNLLTFGLFTCVSQKSLLQFPITGLSAITWHFACEVQHLAGNFCNLHLPCSSPLPLSETTCIFQQLVYFGCCSIFLTSNLFTIGIFTSVFIWWISDICLIYFFSLRNNSSEYFKLSEKKIKKIECCPEACRERNNKSIFIGLLLRSWDFRERERSGTTHWQVH